MPAMAAGTVSPDSSTAVTLRPRFRASRRASDRRLPFQLGSGSPVASSLFFVDADVAAGGGVFRIATVNLGAGGAGAGGAGLLGAGLGSEASGTDGDRGLAAVASIFVMTM